MTVKEGAVPFGLFKKKEAEKSEPAFAAQAPAGDTLSVQQAQALLDSIDSARVQSLCARLAPAREQAARALAALADIAGGMEREKLKLEDLERRYGSNIENARKTVVSALKREAQQELPQLQALADAKRLRERLESMLHRFGEVSGSHSKMLNYFLKKHAASMKGEFETLESALKDVKAAMSAFDSERTPQVRCAGLLNTVLQKQSSEKADELAAQAADDRAGALQNKLAALKEELAALEGSPEFAQARAAVDRLADAEKRQEQFRARVAEMFSHVSRALSKYSYGVSRETERRLRTLADEPWSALGEDMEPYSQLLAEVYKSIASGQIQLKDSDRVLAQLASIQSALAQLQAEARAIAEQVSASAQANKGAVRRAGELRAEIAQHEEGIAGERQSQEQLKRQAAQTRAEVDGLLKEASEELFSLTGRRYAISR
jgi:chromosome segregation ATPase